MVSVKELRQYLDTLGIKYSKKDKKKQLLDLFPRGKKEKEKPIEVFIPKGTKKVDFLKNDLKTFEKIVEPRPPPKRTMSQGATDKTDPRKVPELKETLKERGFKGVDLQKKKAELTKMVDEQKMPPPKKESTRPPPKRTMSQGSTDKTDPRKVPELKETLKERGFKGVDLQKKKAELTKMVDEQKMPTPKKESTKPPSKQQLVTDAVVAGIPIEQATNMKKAELKKVVPSAFEKARKEAEENRKKVGERMARRPSVIDQLKDKVQKAEAESKILADRIKKVKQEKAIKLVTSLQTQARGKKARDVVKTLKKKAEVKNKAFEDLTNIAEKAKKDEQAKRDFVRLLEAQKKMSLKDKKDLRRKSEVDFVKLLEAQKAAEEKNAASAIQKAFRKKKEAIPELKRQSSTEEAVSKGFDSAQKRIKIKKAKETRRQTREDLKARKEFEKIKLATEKQKIIEEEREKREEKLKREEEEKARREEKLKREEEKKARREEKLKREEEKKARQEEKLKREEEQAKKQDIVDAEQEKKLKIRKTSFLKNQASKRLKEIGEMAKSREKAKRDEKMVQEEQEKRKMREKAQQEKAKQEKARLDKERDDIELARAIAREKIRERKEAIAQERQEKARLDKERDDIELARAIAREKTRERKEAIAQERQDRLERQARETREADESAREKALGVNKINFIKSKIESFSPPTRMRQRVQKKEEARKEIESARIEARKSINANREKELRQLGFLPAEEPDLLQIFNENKGQSLNNELDKTELKDFVEEAKKNDKVIQPGDIAISLPNYTELRDSLGVKNLDKSLRGYITHLKGKLPKKSDLNLYEIPTRSPISGISSEGVSI